jgi:hypothetical protein
MTAKPPTVQGINALLRKAGFEQAVVTNNNRYHKEHTEGFRVAKYPGGVIVNWWPDTTRPATSRTAAQAEQDRRTQREMITRYAEAIGAAGWSVKVTLSLGTVTVYPATATT